MLKITVDIFRVYLTPSSTLYVDFCRKKERARVEVNVFIADVENLGNSTLVTFMIINLVVLLGYLMDGREAIQTTILEVRPRCRSFPPKKGTGNERFFVLVFPIKLFLLIPWTPIGPISYFFLFVKIF